jgi:hypothetical protein
MNVDFSWQRHSRTMCELSDLEIISTMVKDIQRVSEISTLILTGNSNNIFEYIFFLNVEGIQLKLLKHKCKKTLTNFLLHSG